ncbi:hypothetical protein P7C70_g1577, partial [Phenoliferia sp. Uapishka_3]
MGSPPRASLGVMPAELKSLIVKLVASQDSAYKDRVNITDEHDEFEKVTRDALPNYGNTLSTLRLLNKEFSELGAVAMFSTIDARGSRHPVFRFRVMYRYGSYVQHIRFSASTTAEQAVQTVAAFGRFPNLHQLYFCSDDIIDFIMGKGSIAALRNDPTQGLSAADPNFAFATEELASKAQRITDLHLDDMWRGWTAGPFLSFFPNLTRLTLHADLLDDNFAGVEGLLVTVVKSLRSLTFLDIRGGRTVRKGWYTDWPPDLRIKRITTATFDLLVNQWKMVECLGAHLKVLEMYFEEFQDTFKESFPLSPNPTLIFPQLRRLALKGVPLTDEAALPFLARFTSAPITDLHISVTTPETLPFVFQHFPNLQRITIDQSHEEALRVAEGLHQSSTFCAAKAVECVLKSVFHPSMRSCDLLPLPTPSPEDANGNLNFAAVQRALDFGQSRLDRAKLDGDFDWGIEKAMVVPLERLRLAWED